MAADLRTLLYALTSGTNVLTPEMLDYYGGKDAILAALHSFDPNATLTRTQVGGGEGGPSGEGWRIDFDVTKAPRSDAGTLGYDLRADNFGAGLKDPSAVVDDPNFGKVTNSSNIKEGSDPWWTYAAPLLVAVGGPLAGAALAGAGIGGAAGLTSAVTGSGMGGSTLASLGGGGAAAGAAPDFSPISWTPPGIDPMLPTPSFAPITSGGTLATLGGAAAGATGLGGGGATPTQGDLGITESGGFDVGGGFNPALTKLYDTDPTFGSLIGQLGKALGIDGKSVMNLLPSLLGIGASVAGGINSTNATNKASDMLQQAAKDANAQAAEIIGKAQANFAPYISTGQQSNADLYALTKQPGLAASFAPVNSYAFTAPRGTVSLAELMKR